MSTCSLTVDFPVVTHHLRHVRIFSGRVLGRRARDRATTTSTTRTQFSARGRCPSPSRNPATATGGGPSPHGGSNTRAPSTRRWMWATSLRRIRRSLSLHARRYDRSGVPVKALPFRPKLGLAMTELSTWV
jgi:hypothetical protein